MDDSSQSQELLDSVEMVSELRTGVSASAAPADNEMKGDEEGEPPPELINTQYINIHRVPEALVTKGLVDVSSPAPPGLISSELIQHHVVHGGMVVDMMVPPVSSSSEFSPHVVLDRAALPTYIPEHYDASDDLLSHELTEDDRRLAAALVAVQLVQHQKQQQLHHPGVTAESNVIVTPNGLPGLITAAGHLAGKVQVPVSLSDHHMTTMTPMSPSAGVSEGKPGIASMVSTYMQTVDDEAAGVSSSAAQQHLLDQQGERILKMYQPTHQNTDMRLPPLPPLKKVLLNPSLSIRNRYMRPHLIEVNPDGTVDDLGQIHPQHGISLAGEPQRLMGVDDELKEEYDVKCENVDDELVDDSDEMPHDENDSDYDAESDLKSSRRSLPHKKRIPRKLKNLKKANSPSRSIHAKCYKCNKCGEQFTNQTAYSAHRLTHTAIKKLFNCELCGKGFANQLKFFEHLKSHYEPAVAVCNSEQITPKPSTAKEKVVQTKEDAAVKEESGKQLEIQDSVGAIPPPLTCNHCGKTFRRQKAFETHMNVAHPKQEEIEEFSEPEDLMEGIRGVVEVGAGNSGDEGDMACLTPTPMMRMIKNNNEKEWYREEDLHAAEADLQEIEQQHQQNEQHSTVCELCGDMFDSKAHLSQHVRQEHLEFSLETGSGEFVSSDPAMKEDLLNSAKRRVTGKRPRRPGIHLTCPQCGRMFNHRNSLVYHLRSHTGDRPHQCEVCGKSFFAASALKVHMRLHSGDKPYKCEFCGRHFRQWGDLKYHCISIHSEEKNYQCEYCGKDFARKYSLIVHRRIHTGEKNYKCEFCGKSFRASSYLQNHRRIHTGEKPHPCEVCGKPFRVRSDMKRHLNTHNRERHRGSGPPASNGIVMTESSGVTLLHDNTPKLEQADPDQLDAHGLPTSHTISVEQPITDLSSVGDIAIQQDSGSAETILPDEQQPINLNRQGHAIAQLAAAQVATVSEEVLHYARDPLETKPTITISRDKEGINVGFFTRCLPIWNKLLLSKVKNN